MELVIELFPFFQAISEGRDHGLDKIMNRIYSILKFKHKLEGEEIMPSTTIHINDELLLKLDQVAKEKGISRNRFIIQACQMALDNNAGRWPQKFFKTGLKENDLRLLKEGVLEMERDIISMRRNRGDVQL